jgi:hypothetical protein
VPALTRVFAGGTVAALSLPACFRRRQRCFTGDCYRQSPPPAVKEETVSTRIRLDVQPRDGVGASVYRHYHADYNIGAQNTIYAGGDKPGYLLLPVIPPKAASSALFATAARGQC